MKRLHGLKFGGDQGGFYGTGKSGVCVCVCV